MKPENGCSFSPILSVENGMKWIWMSGEASRGLVLKNAPDVPAAIVSGPVREKPHIARPPSIRRSGWLTTSFSVTRLRAAHDQADLQMVLQIVADAGASSTTSMPCDLQQFGGPDAGELQQLRRIVRAARDQHFLPRPRGAQTAVLPVFDGPRAAPFEQDALRQRVESRPADCRGPSPAADRRYALLARRPRRVVVWKKPAPSCVAPLKSGLTGMPVSAAASTKASDSGSALPPVRHRRAARRRRDIRRRRAAGSRPS